MALAMALPLKQRLGGFLMFLLTLGGTVGIWYEAVHNGTLYEKASMLFPAFLVLSVAVMLFPTYKDERTARGEDISQLHGWKLFTPVWRWVLILSLLVGFANFLVLRLAFNWAE